MLAQILKYGLSLAAAWLLYALVALIRHRWALRDVPKPPYHPILGHLKLMDDCMKLFPPNPHPHTVMKYMHEKYKLPEIWYLDLYPFGPTMICLTSPEVAAYVVQTRSYGKHKMVEELVAPVLGGNSIVALNGAPWKLVHNMLLPAFKPSAVKGLLVAIGEETLVLRDRLVKMSKQGKPVSMEEESGKTIFEISMRALVGVGVGAQKDSGSPIMDIIQQPFEAEPARMRTWNPFVRAMLRWKIKSALKRSTEWIVQRTLDRYQELKATDVKVAGCLMDAVLLDRIRDEQAGHVKLTIAQDKHWFGLWVVQVRALLFGGIGTTMDTLCFTLMLLSIFPEKMKKVREEHDRVCGLTTAGALDLLRDEPHRLSELEYTAAAIKEALRLFPIGFTARGDDKDNGTLTYKSKSYPTKGALVIPVSYIIHHDEANFPEPGKFMPERWLPSSPYPPPARNAFRGFEHGSRACSGQVLAMNEMCTMLLLTVRWLDFELVQDTPDTKPRAEPRMPWLDLDTKVGDMAYQELGFEAKPRNGVRMTIRRTEREF